MFIRVKNNVAIVVAEVTGDDTFAADLNGKKRAIWQRRDIGGTR